MEIYIIYIYKFIFRNSLAHLEKQMSSVLRPLSPNRHEPALPINSTTSNFRVRRTRALSIVTAFVSNIIVIDLDDDEHECVFVTTVVPSCRLRRASPLVALAYIIKGQHMRWWRHRVPKNATFKTGEHAFFSHSWLLLSLIIV